MTSRYSKRGRALSPSRSRVLELLETQTDAVSVTALTVATGLHENTIRGHLSGLHKDGFIDRVAEENDGRGRPQWLWYATKSTATIPAIEHSEMVLALAHTLEAISPDPTPAALAAGRQWGRELLRSGKIRPRTNVPSVSADETADASADAGMPDTEKYSATKRVSTFLAEFGFAPRQSAKGVVELHNCPILDQATQAPHVICPMHLGLIQGVLESDGLDASASILEPFPTPHVCVLRLKTSPLLADAANHSSNVQAGLVNNANFDDLIAFQESTGREGLL